MRLRTFTAPDMPDAMRQVREVLGDDAVILSSERQRGRKGVRVTAALNGIDHAEAYPVSPHDEAAADRLRYDLRNLLQFHNLPDLFVARMMQKAANDMLSPLLALQRKDTRHDSEPLMRQALGKLMESCFQFAPLPLGEQGMRLMLVGPPGAGKTLGIARLATQLAMNKEQEVTVITTDNKRAGGIEQLQAFTSILGLELKVAADPRTLKKEAARVRKDAVLLIDTAGCNPYDSADMAELQEYVDAARAEPVLVLPAGGDSLEAIDLAESFVQLPLKRLLVTRTDTARRFGSVLAAAAAHNFAFCNASYSPSIVDRLKEVDAEILAQFLLRQKMG